MLSFLAQKIILLLSILKYEIEKDFMRKKGLIVFVLTALVAAYLLYFFMYKSNTGNFKKGDFLYIKTGDKFSDVFNQLVEKHFIRDTTAFLSMANNMHYTDKVKAGKYKIEIGMSNYQIIKMLRSSNQEIVKLSINKLRKKEQLAAKLASKLEPDSAAFMRLFRDTNFLKKYAIDSNQIMSLILPYTYDFYWNTNVEKVLEKMFLSYKKFWTEKRKQQAKDIGLNPSQVIILASIVDEESNKNDEKGNIASVYLNRIKKGMKLQADPTARFAYGDFSIKRVLNKHTQFASPWNTYYVQGLPPGPICNPSESSIDAVLNAPKTDYLFFCAKEDFSGYHNFASNDIEHANNAKKFQKAMDERGIKR